jgi:hypothetical protein
MLVVEMVFMELIIIGVDIVAEAEERLGDMPVIADD